MAPSAITIGVAVMLFAAYQTISSDPRRAAAMHEALGDVIATQAAIVRGDLDAMRLHARRLTTLAPPSGLPESAHRHVQSINAAAHDAIAAATPAGAAMAAARMLAACGHCHRAVGTMPAVSSPRLPTVGGTVGHMLEHQRAVDQLLRGLIVPSNQEWQTGARGLRASPLHARELPARAQLAPELLRVEEAVHRLAEDAVAAETADSRVRVYSTLLARCADCHGLHRKIWGPPSVP
jgi:cytochrome c553